MNETVVQREVVPGVGRRLNWGAIFAGFFVAVGIHMLLALLGIAIGLSTWSPADPGGPGAGDVATGVGIWAAISALIALFVGGATTGHLAGWLRPLDGFLHGAILWALVTVAMVWLIVGGMGFLLGGAFGVVGQTASATVAVAGQAATEVAPAMISLADEDTRQQIATEIAQRTGLDASDVQEVVEQAEQRAQEVRGAVSEGVDTLQQRAAEGELLTDQQRSALLAAISQRTGISPDSARAILAQAETRAREAGEQARQRADTLRDQAAMAAEQLSAERQALSAEISQRTGLSQEASTAIVVAAVGARQDVRQEVSQRAEARVDETRRDVVVAADKAIHSTASGAWWTLFALGLSLGAAGTGATITARR